MFSYYIYLTLKGIIIERFATIIAIIFAVIIYVLAIVVLKVFSKEEIKMLPAGDYIVKVLEKFKIYFSKLRCAVFFVFFYGYIIVRITVKM